MGLNLARAWLVFDTDTFRKPCAFVRGNGFISQPFFSKEMGRIAIAMVRANVGIDDYETEYLLSTLRKSGLCELRDPWDGVLSSHNTAVMKVLNALAKAVMSPANKSLDDETVASMFKPLNPYFDCADVLLSMSSVPPPAKKSGTYLH